RDHAPPFRENASKLTMPSVCERNGSDIAFPRRSIAHIMPYRKATSPPTLPRETSLYLPVKRFLEGLGFDVKGEVCGCDLIGLRGGEPSFVVVGELKLAFNLELVLQGIDRTAACDEVWLAVLTSARA